MLLQDAAKNTKVILASQSPRRQKLLHELQIPFEVVVREGDEIFPSSLENTQVPAYLAEKKSQWYNDLLEPNTLLITADTVVILNHKIIGKPVDEKEAFELIKQLSGNTHLVVTGVCLRTLERRRVFSSVTNVTFRKLTDAEIEYYIRTYKPFDKAGAYGIQEWIGYVGVEKIEGSFYNVMGLPTQQLHTEMMNLLKGLE